MSRSFVSIVRRAGRAWRTEVRSKILGRSTIFMSPATSRGRSKASTSVRFSVAASIGLACSAALCWAVVGLVGPAGAGAHGNAHARVAVADGVPVREGQYRFATKLTMTNIPRPDGTHYDSACSAALIVPQWIVTAGHCFHDVNRNRVSGPPLYQTTATICAADLSDPWAHVVDVMYAIQSPSTDVAIARLAHPIRIVRPLRLSFTAPTVGEVVRLTGWGATSDVMPVPATHLQTGAAEDQRGQRRHGYGRWVPASGGHERVPVRLGRPLLYPGTAPPLPAGVGRKLRAALPAYRR